MSLSLKSSAPFTVRSIDLGTSTPRLQPSIDLSSFTELTSFYGGNNSLSSITGFSSLTALEYFHLGTVNGNKGYANANGTDSTVRFHYSSLPPNLKAFYVNQPNSYVLHLSGTFKDLPRNLEHFATNNSQNSFLSGDIEDIPRTAITFYGGRWGSYTGHLSAVPRNVTHFGLATNQLNTQAPIKGRFSDLPSSLQGISFYETNLNGCELVWSEMPPLLSGFNITQATISGSFLDVAPRLKSMYIGRGVLFTQSINMQDLSRDMVYLYCAAYLKGDLADLPPSLSGALTFWCPVSGNLSGVPPGVTTLDLRGSTYNGSNNWGANTVSGNINLLNTPNLTTLYLGGNNSITGDLSGIPRSVTRYEHVNTQNTVTGNVSSLPPNLTYYDKRGNGLITGDVAGIPRSVTYFNKSSNNSSTLTGNISGLPPSIGTFIATAPTNTFSGDLSGLPRTLTNFSVGGGPSMTITGNISSLPPNLTTYLVEGSTNLSTIVIDTSNIPSSITSFTQQGSAYTMFGNLTGLPSTIRNFATNGRRANISYYDGFTEGFGKKVWSSINTVNINVSAGGTFPASHLATLLVDLSAATWYTTGSRFLTLNDSSMPRISLSAYPQAKDAIEFLRRSTTQGGRSVAVSVLTAA